MEIRIWFLIVKKRKNISLAHFAFEDEDVGVKHPSQARLPEV